MQRFAFIPCTKSKAEAPCTARLMYWPSAGFRGAWDYAQAHGLIVIIFSAKYGALSPEDEIEPYDETLTGASKAARERWTAEVLQQLGMIGSVPEIVAGDQVVSFLPRAYGAILHQVLRDAGVNVQEPLQGLRPGERLAWFKKQREAPAT